MSDPTKKLESRAVSMDPRDVLNALRWTEDMRVVNDFGEYVWLCPLIRDGVRIGITDCCLVDDPCLYHRKLAEGGNGS